MRPATLTRAIGTRECILAALMLVGSSALRAQSAQPYGWLLTLRVGFSYGRAVCDSPCLSTTRHAGTHIAAFLGHSLGDRTVIGFGSTAFSSVGDRRSPNRWGAGGAGVQVGARPSPTDNASAFALLGIGEAEIGPRDNRAHPVAAIWSLGAAVDDLAKSSFGGYGELHGTIGARMPDWSEHPKQHISTFGVAGGPQYTRR